MAPSLSPTGFWCNASPKRVLSAPRSRGDGDTARPEAAPLPLKHPNRDHLQGGRLLIPLRRVGRHDDRARTYRVLSGRDSPARGAACAFEITRVVLSRG